MNSRLARYCGILGLIFLLIGVGGLIGDAIVGVSIIPYFFNVHLILGLIFIFIWFGGHGFTQLGKKEGIVSSRRLTFGFSAILYSLLFISLIVGANWFANRYNKRIDLTEEGVFSLAPQSIKIAKGLKQDLRITAFKPVNVDALFIKDILNLYKSENSEKIDFKIVDPVTKPQLIEQYEMENQDVLHLAYGDGKNKSVSRIGNVSEEQITNAILKLSKGTAKKLYYITGHGEPELESTGPQGLKTLHKSIIDQNLKIESLSTLTLEKMPEDAAAVLLVAPKVQLQQSEVDMLVSYAESGGSLVLMADPRNFKSVARIAENFYVKVNDNIIIDIANRRAIGPSYGIEVVSSTFSKDHPITKDFSPRQPVVFSQAVSLSKIEKKGGIKGGVVELVQSSPKSWAESDLQSIYESEQPQVNFDEDTDVQGPLAIGVAFENKVSEKAKDSKKSTKVAVFGDSDWVSNAFISPGVGPFNMDLALNVIGWAAGEESSISIRPRSMKFSNVSMSLDTLKTISALGFLIPEIVLIVGLTIWWRRKGITA